jgi:hypothetical protein
MEDCCDWGLFDWLGVVGAGDLRPFWFRVVAVEPGFWAVPGGTDCPCLLGRREVVAVAGVFPPFTVL